MISLKKEWLNWIIILVPFVFIILNWNNFPDQVPIHFNVKGEIDDYANKTFGLLLIPVLNVLNYFLTVILPKIDPRKKNYDLFMNRFSVIRTVIYTFLSVLSIVLCTYALGHQFNSTVIVQYISVIFLLVLGNYIGTVRSNYFVGIRVPWTLENETIWNLTHRFAAKLWVVASLLMLIILYTVKEVEFIFMFYIGVIALVPIVYSYIKHKQLVS